MAYIFYNSVASPFGRKVRIAAGLRQVDDLLVPHAVTFEQLISDFGATNPLGKIPALLVDGALLVDSRVICEFLDHQGDAPPLFPDMPAPRFRALSRAALADGVMDAAVLCRLEGTRPDEPARAEHKAFQMAKVDRALDWFEALPAELNTLMDIGDVTLASALGYLDFRFAERDWRASRPNLAAWFERVSALPIMRRTAPA